MATQWQAIERRRDQLNEAVADHTLDSKIRHTYQKELTHLNNLLAAWQQVAHLEKTIHETQQQSAQNSDAQMAELFVQELADLHAQLIEQQQRLDVLVAPADEHDDRSAYLEIRAGTGGQEAALFAADLLRMYTNYGLKRGWKVSVESVSETDLGGFKDVVAHVKGKNVFGQLKYESGVHRVQRVPSTETSGRIHTSTATVAVLPEAEDVDVSIDPADLRIDVFRASGAGGQHVNTTDSAVRITHIPTGVVVSCQDERSQHKNKAKAMKILQARLLAAMVEKQEAQMSQKRRELIGGGKRAEKVRTYNFPQNRVTDHQVGITLQKLDMVMAGELDEIVDALVARDQEVRKEEFLQKFTQQ